jgi:hypothetical protein
MVAAMPGNTADMFAAAAEPLYGQIRRATATAACCRRGCKWRRCWEATARAAYMQQYHCRLPCASPAADSQQQKHDVHRAAAQHSIQYNHILSGCPAVAQMHWLWHIISRLLWCQWLSAVLCQHAKHHGMSSARYMRLL